MMKKEEEFLQSSLIKIIESLKIKSASDHICISMNKTISRIRKEDFRKIVSIRDKWLPEKKRPRKENKKFQFFDTHKIIII